MVISNFCDQNLAVSSRPISQERDGPFKKSDSMDKFLRTASSSLYARSSPKREKKKQQVTDEEVVEDLHGYKEQELEGRMLQVRELRKTYANGFTAVKGLNVKMYTGQIFALLGHNGAGKTTLISMLTGLLSPTSGDAEVFGFDIFEDINRVRDFLGVCPQHNILFDLLTPREHLEIFSDFKGMYFDFLISLHHL